MRTYKFETVIQNDGIIKIPEIKKLVNHSVEILIIDKSPNDDSNKDESFDDFKKKWAGFLGKSNINENYEEEKLRYLKDKYK